ncbi:hypothetical protein ACJMK2_016113 [Sinanodonta woodiana]|uniref:Dol-P-Glc:Glc(2)Man(9)GlcNAc(2)-PP-Dol alpha-1,2-glucosyltransferase n=1 Tax=Sinanodonta woodiana TaxID=1069815 RepID=A0ABD3UW17_SINWO
MWKAALIVLFVIFTGLTFIYVYHVQPTPYMDEVFHIPQAQQYCKGNFSFWDPMITTLPGLYMLSVGVMAPIGPLLSLDSAQICSPLTLRLMNVFFCLGNFCLIYTILKRMSKDTSEHRDVFLKALTLASFPLLYFFSFLYYTDSGSTFFVLIMYLFCLHNNQTVAAIMGVLAILFRQTNIVWVVFIAGFAVSRRLLEELKLEKKDLREELASDREILKVTLDLLFSITRQGQRRFIRLFWNVVTDTWIYMIIGIGFILFLYINEGIVVGDRSHHTPCFHFPQMFYFISFTNFFASFHLISSEKLFNWLKFCVKNPLVSLSFLGVSFALVSNFTYVHEYILADNRHYTFYVWHKIYRQHAYVKYILIPMYYVFAYNIVTSLSHKNIFWRMLFFLCTSMTIVPQKILEFRYFIIPYLIFRMNMKSEFRPRLVLELLLYMSLNIVTLYLFTQKPFMWSNSDQLQRFMW